MKRLFDIIFAVAVLLVAMPILSAAAAAVWFTDGRPLLFKQTRMGLYGRPFELFKFRTMVKNAEKIGGHSTQTNDPRITPTGKFLRRTSIDELPQLLNVIRGDMSVVGPRPDVAKQVSDYSVEDWKLRCSVRPGITGLAQAKLRSAATPEQRLALDLQYARDHRLLRDIAIVAATAAGLFRKGVN
jgi:lipopolysaccharide/colanic/teichoic acid biosynthesis glycosyltransferase